MKLELKMTKRDRVLLLFLFLFLVIGGYFYFGIFKAQDRIDELTTQIENLEMRKQSMEMRISQIPIYEANIENAKKSLEEAGEALFPMMTSEDVDAYLTSMFVDAGLKMNELTIQTSMLLEVEPYLHSERMDILSSEEDSEEQGISITTENVYSCAVICEATGTKTQLLRILDRLAETDGIRVDSFSISDVTRQNSSGKTARYVVRKNLTLSLIIYMYGK